jgi:hypothetical protein
MRLGGSHTKNEVPSGCTYIRIEAKPFLGERICSKTRGVYVVNWGVRIVGPFKNTEERRYMEHYLCSAQSLR